MKKITNVLYIMAALSLLGCKKDFLDKEPLATTTTLAFYKTESDAIAAINAAYDPAGWDNTRASFNGEFFYGDIVSDDALKGGENDGDMAYMHDLEIFKGQASNPGLRGLYSRLYQGIYRCNLVLEHVPGISMNETLKGRILGEAKFLRGYYYFFLLRMFGGVPLITKLLKPEEYLMPKSSKAEVYAQIEKDLMEAASALPEKSQYAAEDLGRATKGAANSLLVRVYVYEQKWPEAQALAQVVINSNQYDLDPDYAHIFKVAGEGGIESIFEIQHISSNDPGWGDANEGTFINILTGSRKGNFGWGFLAPTQDFVNEFEPNDPRLDATVIFDGEVLNGEVQDNGDSPTKMHSQKYLLAPNERPDAIPNFNGDIMSNGQSNIRVLRYADLLLMAAEAAYHNSDETNARIWLNKVRQRARTWSGNNAILPDVNATGTALLDAIYHERRVELGLEGIRFFDIVRQGRAAAIMQAQGYDFVAGIHELFPIPQEEIQASQGKVIQNFGY